VNEPLPAAARLLRVYLVACVAVALVYLVIYLREPLRLNLGDPWADASTLAAIHSPTIHYPPLAELVYAAAGQLGVDDLVALRLIALGFSALAVWLLYHYVRLWSATIAMIATAVWWTSLLWLMFADVYRLDRATILDAAARSLPVTRVLDLGGVGARPHLLVGWSKPWLTPESIGISSIGGFATCRNPIGGTGNRCETVMSRSGMRPVDQGWSACDLPVTLRFAGPAMIGVSINEFTASQCSPADQLTFVVPQRAVPPGINVVALSIPDPPKVEPKDRRADVASLSIEPLCKP
jgi:hypothetical protein